MKIGIDIDNVIADTLPVLKKYCKRYNDTIVKRDLQMHENGGASYTLYDWTEKENTDFCLKYLEEVVLQAKIKDKANEVIKKLKDEGNEIYIISARAVPIFKTPYETTEKYLKENEIVYDKLLVGKIEKKPFCIEHNLDVLIEDEPKYINQMSEFMKVIVMDALHNKECKGKNIIRVNNWEEVYKVIRKLNNL